MEKCAETFLNFMIKADKLDKVKTPAIVWTSEKKKKENPRLFG